MKRVNKVIGNNVEQEVIDILTGRGFWTHLFTYSPSGQPCDIIAFKNKVLILADVKNCEGKLFGVQRIETNQRNCFIYAKMKGAENVGFIIKHNEVFYWLPFERVEKMYGGSVRVEELETLENYLYEIIHR